MSERKPQHSSIRALDPPGDQPGGRPRKWRCFACGVEGTLSEVSAVPCTAAKVGPLSPEEQIRQWADGHPSCPNSAGECCPDFSCCKPELLAPVEAREAFRDSTPEQRERFLMGFLGAAISAGTTKRVHITRGEPEKDRES